MKVTVDNLVIDYEKRGKGEKTVLVLHGWSSDMSKERYRPLTDLLALKYKVVILDLPGFGGSSQLDRVFGVEDYAKLIAGFLKETGLKPDLILGHSFGGRIAIKIAAKKLIDFERLILVDSAGIEKKSLKAQIIIKITSLMPVFLKNMMRGFLGSKDYREAGSEIMRETMKKVVNENLENDLMNINKKTLLIWGRDDKMTPLENGIRMQKLIKNSELTVLDGGHGLPYRNADEVWETIKEQIND